jgi:hypothetical protein
MLLRSGLPGHLISVVWLTFAVAAAAFCVFLIRLPTWAQTSRACEPELVRRLPEDSFGLASLCLIRLVVALAQPGLRAVIQKNSDVSRIPS